MAAGVICCAAGVACFLAIARPHGGRTTVSFGTFLPLALAMAAVVVGCLAAAQWGSRQARPLWLALACGVDFGVNALIVMTGGIVALAHRAPQVTSGNPELSAAAGPEI